MRARSLACSTSRREDGAEKALTGSRNGGEDLQATDENYKHRRAELPRPMRLTSRVEADPGELQRSPRRCLLDIAPLSSLEVCNSLKPAAGAAEKEVQEEKEKKKKKKKKAQEKMLG